MSADRRIISRDYYVTVRDGCEILIQWAPTVRTARAPASLVNGLLFAGLVEYIPSKDMFGVLEESGPGATADILEWICSRRETHGAYIDPESDDVEIFLEYLPAWEDRSRAPNDCFCDEEYDEDEHVAVALPCGHGFGESCLKSWFSSTQEARNRCPMCRRKLYEIQPPQT
ncbi:hypothetical protein DM02DRAFT_683768 [Periconia macrospinosa]|uniref:RING-type domain-containing protein n=1 Tax=Periconia macrospinosa TaxID=97972 RepID=A0A2V1DIX8_9PLEO|nr:hypothetical protein DM02DRAFT_683768 [Periconia macrospinosa]